MKLSKRKLLFCCCILLVSSFIALAVLCFNFGVFSSNENAYAAEQDGDGSGTQNDPYLIGSANTLNSSGMRNNFGTQNTYFKLIDNIDLISFTNWVPIPNFAAGCVFDGNQKTISNLTMTGRDINGLFARVEGGTIKDLTIENVKIDGSYKHSHTGTLAGIVSGTVNCINVHIIDNGEGYIKNIGARTGGIFGHAIGTVDLTIDMCYVIGLDLINVGNTSGGILGCYEEGIGNENQITIKNSYHIGNISGGSSIIAGILGSLFNVSNTIITIENCFHIGDLSFFYSFGFITGGIFAYSYSAPGSKVNIINCYASGIFSDGTDASRTGGIYGGRDQLVGTGILNVDIKNSYYNEDLYSGPISGSYNTTNVETDAKSGGRTEEYMQSQDFIDDLGSGFIFNPNPPHYPIIAAFGSIEIITVIFNFNYYYAPPPPTITTSLGQNIEIIEPYLGYVGYEFINWNTDPDGSGAAYNPLVSVPIDELITDGSTEITFFAQWKLITYTLTVETEPGGYSANFTNGTSIDMVDIENKDIAIIADSTDFIGWEVKSGAIWKPLDGYYDNILNIEDIIDKDFISFYAYDDNGTPTISFRAVFSALGTYNLIIKTDRKDSGLVKVNGIPLDYNVSRKFIRNTTVELLTEVDNKYYKFKEYSVNEVTEIDIDHEFTINQDTEILVFFERIEYINSITISSKDISDNPISDLAYIFVKDFKINDTILITYDVNANEYKFVSLYILAKNGKPYYLQTDDSGALYLKLTKAILDDCFDGSIQIVAVYAEQYRFKLSFDEQRMGDWCQIDASFNTAAGDVDLNLNAVYYFGDKTEITINIKLRDGYNISSVIDILSGKDFYLINGQDLTITLTSARDIKIKLAAIVYTLKVDALDIGDPDNPVPIQEVFGAETEYFIEYNGQSDPVERNNLSGYRFIGWYILNCENGEWEELDTKFINDNKLVIVYSYLDAKYIDEITRYIKVEARYIPVYTLTINKSGNASGLWDYEAKINNIVENNFKSGQFDYGTTVVITIKHSDYIKFKFTQNGSLQTTPLKDGFYILTFDLTKAYIVDLDFEFIVKTLSITENFSGAEGSFTLKGVDKNSNGYNVKLGDTLIFEFDVKSGQKINEWTIKGSTVKTVDELVAEGCATRNGNTVELKLDEKTLGWLTGNGEATVTINTIFDPLFIAIIAGGSVLIAALILFIILFMRASNKKKKKIKAAVDAGIIGAARFKTNFHEDI